MICEFLDGRSKTEIEKIKKVGLLEETVHFIYNFYYSHLLTIYIVVDVVVM